MKTWRRRLTLAALVAALSQTAVPVQGQALRPPLDVLCTPVTICFRSVWGGYYCFTFPCPEWPWWS